MPLYIKIVLLKPLNPVKNIYLLIADKPALDFLKTNVRLQINPTVAPLKYATTDAATGSNKCNIVTKTYRQIKCVSVAAPPTIVYKMN